eukprot:gene14365-biopygen6574
MSPKGRGDSAAAAQPKRRRCCSATCAARQFVVQGGGALKSGRRPKVSRAAPAPRPRQCPVPPGSGCARPKKHVATIGHEWRGHGAGRGASYGLHLAWVARAWRGLPCSPCKLNWLPTLSQLAGAPPPPPPARRGGGPGEKHGRCAGEAGGAEGARDGEGFAAVFDRYLQMQLQP